MTLLASLRDWLKAQQLDAVLLSSRQNKQPHLGISTGSGYVVISRESAHILVDSRYYVEVEARAQGYQLHLLDATNTLTTIVNQIIADEQLQTLGFEGQQVSWETAHRWQSELNAKLVSATPDVLRQIKTPEEVEKIRLACGIADRGAEHIRRFIQAGMSEREIAAELEWFMRQQGAEKASFDTIVASGWRGALPHGKASDKIVAAGEFVTLDFGALYQGYCSDMTRTLLVLSDKSLIAPPKLTAWVETVAAEIGVPLQADMFSNGGTDGGAVHLTGTGVPTVVMGPATRHGHCAASIADCRDILQMQQLLSALIQRLTRETVVQLTDFR
ncbi:aminopeptidase [Escherichia coli]|nr:aminopeptidase [Escherichia coli]